MSPKSPLVFLFEEDEDDALRAVGVDADADADPADGVLAAVVPFSETLEGDPYPNGGINPAAAILCTVQPRAPGARTINPESPPKKLCET